STRCPPPATSRRGCTSIPPRPTPSGAEMPHPTGAALLVIDMQNGFVDPDGAVPRPGAPMPEAARVVAESSELAAAARAASLPVVYTAHVLDPDYFDAPARIVRRGVLNREEQALVRGTW